MTYGYARVSGGQSVAAQVAALTADRCDKIIIEVASGGADRSRLKATVARMIDGNTLKVTRLLRLARSTCALATITRQRRNVQIAVRHMGRHYGRARGPVTMLVGLAEFERDLIPIPASEGRERTKLRGAKMGHKLKLTPHQIKEILRRKEDDEPMHEIARSHNVHGSTISRLSNG
jgi:DNA invertase Pin-like site-specific DNA recombinase